MASAKYPKKKRKELVEFIKNTQSVVVIEMGSVDCVFSQRRENVNNDKPSRECKRQQTVYEQKVNNTRDFYSGSAPIVGNSLIHLEL